MEGSSNIALDKSSLISVSSSKLLCHSFKMVEVASDKCFLIPGSFSIELLNETKSLAFAFLLDILPTILSIS